MVSLGIFDALLETKLIAQWLFASPRIFASVVFLLSLYEKLISAILSVFVQAFEYDVLTIMLIIGENIPCDPIAQGEACWHQRRRYIYL